MIEDQATFVCGHPKSGTSLLRGLLDSHPQLIVFPEETKFFRRVLPALAGLDPDRAAAVVEDRVLGMLRWNVRAPVESQAGFLDRDYSHLPREAIMAAYRRRAASCAQATALLGAAILAYGEGTGQLGPDTVRWVEKSPYNERFADRAAAAWPQARFVHVVRDPRDNFASYRRKHPDWTAAVFAESWRRSTHLGWKNEAALGLDRYRMLRYEDLVLQTESVVADLVGFLGIEPAPGLIRPTRDGRAWTGNSMFGEAFDQIDSRPVGRHAQDLELEASREIERRLEGEMTRLAYPLGRPLSVAERATARLRRLWRSVRGADPLPPSTPAGGTKGGRGG